jgi:hypothetical protein
MAIDIGTIILVAFAHVCSLEAYRLIMVIVIKKYDQTQIWTFLHSYRQTAKAVIPTVVVIIIILAYYLHV